MNDLLRNSLLFGMGVYAKTEREVKKVAAALVKSKKLSKKEGEALVAQALLHAKKAEKQIEARVRRASLDLFRRLKTEAQKDLKTLEKKIKTHLKAASKSRS